MCVLRAQDRCDNPHLFPPSVLASCKKAALECLSVDVSPYVTCGSILDNNFSSSNFILDHEVPILDVIGALGT